MKRVAITILWIVVGTAGLIAGLLTSSALRPNGPDADRLPAGGPPGWVQVDCNPWPGGEGPCYAPPEGDTYTFDGQRCTIVNGRNRCEWISPGYTPGPVRDGHPGVTVSEVVGLDQALAYVRMLADQAGHHCDGESYINYLTAIKVAGDAFSSARLMQSAFRTARRTALAHLAELRKQKTVQEAYDQVPDAGDKDYQTGDASADGAGARPEQPDPAAADRQAEAVRQAEDAVLQAWSQLRMADTSAEALRIRAEAEAIRLRRRPAPADNPYTGKVTLEDLDPDPERPLDEVAQGHRWMAELLDDKHRDGDRSAADSALYWHAAADVLEAEAAAEPPASRAPGPDMDDAGLRQWRHDEMVLAQVGEFYGDEDTPEFARLTREAAGIIRRRKTAHQRAMAAGGTPCPANWSTSTPCVHPDGDGHTGLCFAADGESWPRHTSWYTPEARQEALR